MIMNIILYLMILTRFSRLNKEAKYTQLSPCANVLQLRINRHK